jgi:hypothetical protein
MSRGTEKTMMSACGVLCSSCPAYYAQKKGTRYQKRTVEAWQRIYRMHVTVDQLSCCGCTGPDEDVFHTSRRCKARCCCRFKGFSSYAECPIVFCALLKKAQSVWDGVPNLLNKLSRTYFTSYAQPYCGHRERLASARASFQNKK